MQVWHVFTLPNPLYRSVQNKEATSTDKEQIWADLPPSLRSQNPTNQLNRNHQRKSVRKDQRKRFYVLKFTAV